MLPEFDNNLGRIPEGMKKLKCENNIYLYGNSKYADEMMRRIKKYNVEIDGVLVSSVFATSEVFHGYMPINAEYFLENLEEEIVIIAGFDVLVHKELVEKLVNHVKVSKIYVVDGQTVLWRNNFSFLNTKVYQIDNYYEYLLKRCLDYDYYQQNLSRFKQTYEWLEDDTSRITMEKYLKGHVELSNFCMREIWSKKDLDEQYFPEDVIHLSDEEIFVDCGAFTGDTFGNFVKRVKGFRKYYAIELDERQFKELHNQIKGYEDRVVHVPLGTWNERKKLEFSTENSCGEISISETGNSECIEVDTIDNIIGVNEAVTFLKMDVEGAELPTLMGATDVIKRNKPILAICVYHKREDLIEIPQYIKSIIPEYKFYLRGHYPNATELVLYAICET